MTTNLIRTFNELFCKMPVIAVSAQPATIDHYLSAKFDHFLSPLTGMLVRVVNASAINIK